MYIHSYLNISIYNNIFMHYIHILVVYARHVPYTCTCTQPFKSSHGVSPGRPFVEQAALDVSARALEDLIIEAVMKTRMIQTWRK